MPSRRRYPPSVATASNGVPTVEEREGAKNRRLNLLSTLAATLIGAVIGSLGGAYLGVTVGADRDDDRSNREFLRTQRIALYGEYLAAVDQSQALMDPFIPSSWELGPTSLLSELPVPSEEQRRDIRESIGDVNTLRGRIQVIAGTKVILLATSLLSDLQSAEYTVLHIVYCHDDGSDPARCTSDQVAERGPYHWSAGDFVGDRTEYLILVQDELDVED